MSERSFIVTIPDRYDAPTRAQIGEDIVAFIVNRTNQGLDRFNKPFPKYTKGYVNSLEFRAAGKSENNVNLRLSGDMHASLRVLSHGAGYIKIGFPAQSYEANKEKWNAEKGRDMLGITQKDLRMILDRYPVSRPEFSVLSSFANEVLRRITTDDPR